MSPYGLFRQFQLDAFVEQLVTVVALWQQVDAEVADVLAHVEVLRMVHLVALYLQLQHADAVQAHAVAVLEVLHQQF